MASRGYVTADETPTDSYTLCSPADITVMTVAYTTRLILLSCVIKSPAPERRVRGLVRQISGEQ